MSSSSDNAETEALELLDLPSEILSQIASFLPQHDLLRFLSLNTTLHTLTDTHLTPLRQVIKDIVRRGPPYPPGFEVLPSLKHFVGEDDGRLFLDVLVRAPPRWLLERFEFGSWRDDIWKEAFERRFLPSWKRYKNPEDKWRAAFLRVLGRLEHRAVGCAHHESWTRFIQLRRNGSASLNRIYTRTFDPYEIMDELKQQGSVSEYPTVVRVLCHLQDVRIIAICALADKPSFYVNPNAHFILHPPLLRTPSATSYSQGKGKQAMVTHRNSAPPPGTPSHGIPAPPPRANSVSFAVPVAAAQGPGPPPAPPSTAADLFAQLRRTSSAGSEGSAMNLFGGFTWRPGRRRSVDDGRRFSVDGNAEAGPSTGITIPLSRTWSRDGDRRRSWSFASIGRARTPSSPTLRFVPPPPTSILNHNPASPGTTESVATLAPTAQLEALSLAPITPPSSQPTPTAAPPALPTLPETHSDQPTPTPPTPEPSPPPGRRRYPYRPIEYPTPAYSHTQYPNHTPFAEDPNETTLEALRRVRDFRPDYREVEEDLEDRVWSGNEGIWGADGGPMAEWSVEGGAKQRWVGPMIIIAQLFPGTRKESHPPGAPNDSDVEGPSPNLGPTGMYASLGWEDFDILFPWIELSGAGANHGSRRAGWGFETAEE